jgi:hypothetical protein
MDLTASLRALRRRWILTTLLLLLTLAASYDLWHKAVGPYSAESIVGLIPSTQSSKTNGGNPYLSYSPTENVAGDIVLREVMAPATAATLAAQGDTASYTIADDPNTTGPILDITVTGSSQAVVESTLRGVTDQVQVQLAALQKPLKPANQITSKVLSFATTPSLESSKKARPVVLVLGLGLVLTFALPQMWDAEINRWRRRRNPGYVPAGEPVPEPVADQAPHRRRYRPPAEPQQAPEPVPSARPYGDRSAGPDRSAPVPPDGVTNGPMDRRARREAARRREFTY